MSNMSSFNEALIFPHRNLKLFFFFPGRMESWWLMCRYNGRGYLKLLNKSVTPYAFWSIRNIACSSHTKILLLFVKKTPWLLQLKHSSFPCSETSLDSKPKYFKAHVKSLHKPRCRKQPLLVHTRQLPKCFRRKNPSPLSIDCLK